MSHGLLPSPSGLTLALPLYDGFPDSCVFGVEDTAERCTPDGCSSHRKPSGTSPGAGNLENSTYVHYTERTDTPKVEEWQLIPDEVFLYLTRNKCAPELEDHLFFQKVARELRFCLKKIDEIRTYNGYNRARKCASVEHPSAESSPISWNSQEHFNLDGECFVLPDIHQVNKGFQASNTAQILDNEQHVNDSNDDFSSISSNDCTLSSFEPVKSPAQSPNSQEDNDDTHHQPLRPEELLVPYTDDDKEAMLFSLVEDLSLRSPVWGQGEPSEDINKDGAFEFIDQQPRSIQSEIELMTNSSSLTADKGYITISYTDSPDSSESDPVSQIEETSVSHAHNVEFLNFKDCLEQIENVEIDVNKMNETEVLGSLEDVPVDNIVFPDCWDETGCQKPPEVPRQKKWWSSEEDRRDINFLKLPTVSAQGLVFHVNQSGAIKVGEGSFGTVFLADLYAQGAVYQVVVKDFSPKGVTKPAEILEEATVLMHLSNTMFVPFFYGVLPVDSPQRYALVQEFFAEGMSLHNIIEDKSRRLSQISWISICVQMAVGLDRFHRKGILMNDIKKDNILVDCRSEECVLKYIDMGLASYKIGRVFYGSEDYMEQFSHLAPEVKRLERTSPASDVYSIGKIMLSIAKSAPLRAIKEFVAPCMSHSSADRPSIREVICKLMAVRDDIYRNTLIESPRPISGSRWFC